MSRFAGGQMRNQAPRQFQRQGIVNTPNAPGEVPVPFAPDPTRGQRLLQALGIAGQAANTVTQLNRREIVDREREQAKIDHQEQGAASLEARSTWPELQQQIANRELLLPDGGDPSAVAEELVGRQVDGASEAFANQYRQVMVPRLTAAFVKQQQGIIDEAKTESVQLNSEAAIGASNAKELRALLDTSAEIAPDMSDTELRATVLMPALQDAVARGDEDKFDAVVEALDGRFPATVNQGRIRLASSQQQAAENAQKEITDRFDNTMARLFNAGHYEAVQSEAERIPDGVDPNKALQWKQKAKSAIEADQDEATDTSKDVINRRAEMLFGDPDKDPVESANEVLELGNDIQYDGTADIATSEIRRQIEFANEAGEPGRAKKLGDALLAIDDTLENRATIKSEVESAAINNAQSIYTTGMNNWPSNGKSPAEIATEAMKAGIKNGLTRDQVTQALESAVVNQLQFAANARTPDGRPDFDVFQDIVDGAPSTPKIRSEVTRLSEQMGAQLDKVNRDQQAKQFIRSNVTRGLGVQIADADMGPLAEVMHEKGMIAASISGNNSVRVRTITDPERAAHFYALNKRIHPDVVDQVSSTFGVATQGADAGFDIAARFYASLYATNPGMAANVRGQMDATGKLRADKLVSELEQNPLPPLGPGQQKPDGSRTLDGNPAFADRVSEIVGSEQYFAVQPSDLSKDDRIAMLAANDPLGVFSEADAVNPMLLKKHARDLLRERAKDIAQDSWRGDHFVSTQATNAFVNMLVDEIGIASANINGSDEQKVAAAMNRAIARFEAKHPPIKWQGNVYVDQEAPYPIGDALAADLDEQIEAFAGQHPNGLSAEQIRQQYRPKWAPTAKSTDGRHTGAWILVDTETGTRQLTVTTKTKYNKEEGRWEAEERQFGYVPLGDPALTPEDIERWQEKQRKAGGGTFNVPDPDGLFFNPAPQHLRRAGSRPNR